MGMLPSQCCQNHHQFQRTRVQPASSTTSRPSPTPSPKLSNLVQIINIKDISDSEQLGTETGYEERENMWLAYKTLNRKDCVVCGHARPILAAHPFSLSNVEGWMCILESLSQIQPCVKLLSFVFPEVPPQKVPWGVKAYGGYNSCITGTGRGIDYGGLPTTTCITNATIN